jgi:hypothetical protein
MIPHTVECKFIHSFYLAWIAISRAPRGFMPISLVKNASAAAETMVAELIMDKTMLRCRAFRSDSRLEPRTALRLRIRQIAELGDQVSQGSIRDVGYGGEAWLKKFHTSALTVSATAP